MTEIPEAVQSTMTSPASKRKKLMSRKDYEENPGVQAAALTHAIVEVRDVADQLVETTRDLIGAIEWQSRVQQQMATEMRLQSQLTFYGMDRSHMPAHVEQQFRKHLGISDS